jgi:putative aldouronate transport system substrate-binding protein
MQKKLVIAALILILCGSVVFAGGGGQSSSSVPTLIWWVIGTPGRYVPDGLKVISDYMEQRGVGARLDIKAAGWGEAGNRFQTIINSGEYYDLMFTDSGNYNSNVALGAYLDITDMIGTTTPQLQRFIPAALWDGVRINNRIYSVPTYKDSSKTEFQIWDEAIVRKYNIDTSKPMDFPELDRVFRQIKAGEGTRFYPLVLSQGATFANGVYDNIYDRLLTGLPPLGVELDDSSRRVVSVYEQPEVMERLRYLHRWYNNGIINPDAPVAQETPQNHP